MSFHSADTGTRGPGSGLLGLGMVGLALGLGLGVEDRQTWVVAGPVGPAEPAGLVADDISEPRNHLVWPASQSLVPAPCPMASLRRI